jgi:ABC-type sugar transport system substrate-binding protein
MKKQSDQRMTKLADAAFRRAAQKVIERAEDAGTPVIVWENEEVTELKPRTAQPARKKKGQETSGNFEETARLR